MKCRWSTALAALVLFIGIGMVGRSLMPLPPPWGGAVHVVWGLFGGAAMIAGDGLIHGVAQWMGGHRYAASFRQLHQTFRDQTWGAIFAGSLLAALGEELVFRGLEVRPVWLFVAALLFGLAHRCPEHAWGFTVWSAWEGVLLGLLVVLSGGLLSAIAAHGIHDLLGFSYFRWLNHAVLDGPKGPS